MILLQVAQIGDVSKQLLETAAQTAPQYDPSGSLMVMVLVGVTVFFALAFGGAIFVLLKKINDLKGGESAGIDGGFDDESKIRLVQTRDNTDKILRELEIRRHVKYN